jgi:hypothetical protein
MPRPAFIYQNTQYEFTHLEPFTHTYIVAKNEKDPERQYAVHVEFTIHCFTSTMKTTDSSSLFYSQDRDGTNRAFHFRRWALSQELKPIIQNLLNERVCITKRDNLVTVPVILENGERINYEVYFKVFKAGAKLFLEVESAYVRETDWTNKPDIDLKMGFGLILKRVQAGIRSLKRV